MINVIKKFRLLPILIAVCAVCAFLGGVTAVFGGRSAVAEDEKTRISFSLDSEDGTVKEILPGDSFVLTTTITCLREESDIYWDVFQLHIGPLNEDKQTLNTDILKYWTWDEDHWYEMFESSVLWGRAPYQTATNLAKVTEDTPYADEGDGFYLSISAPTNKAGYVYCADTNEMVLSARFTVSKDIDPEIESFVIGVQPIYDNGISYGYEGKTTYEDRCSTSDVAVTNTVTVKIRQPGENATLDELTVGHTGAEKTFSVKEDADYPLIAPDSEGQMTYSSNSSDLTDFTVTPTATDLYAKIEVSLKEFGTETTEDASSDSSDAEGGSDSSSDVVVVASGKSTTLTLQPGENILYIRVTSEDEKNTEIYTVKITMAYVRLDGITAAAASAVNGKTTVTPDFDGDTYEYTIKVPEDLTKLDLSATVLSGYAASTQLAVACSDNLTADASFGSGDTIAVTFDTDSEDTFTIELTATASDGVSTAVYKLTVELASIDTKLTSIKAIGADTKNELANNEALATDGIDYYFFVTSETVTGAATFTFTLPDGATVAITDSEGNDTNYDDTVTYTEGTYKVTVTAEAGNTTEYVVVLGKQMYLKLAEGSKYAFLHEYSYVDGSTTRNIRTTYEQLGLETYYGKVWEHGVDDTELERVVLGQVPSGIYVSELLENFEPSQIPFIRIYNNSGTLLYDCGQPAEGLTEEILSTRVYMVTTGWCIKYGADEENADTVYISILGDIYADGAIDTFDMSQIASYILGSVTFDLVEYRLAAYINNGGRIDTFDLSAVSSYIIGSVSMEDYYYTPADSEN